MQQFLSFGIIPCTVPVTIILCNNSCLLGSHFATAPLRYDYTMQQFLSFGITLHNCPFTLRLCYATIPVLQNYTLPCPCCNYTMQQFLSFGITLCNCPFTLGLYYATIPVLRNSTQQQVYSLQCSLGTKVLHLLLQFPPLTIAFCNNSCLLAYTSPLNTTPLGTYPAGEGIISSILCRSHWTLPPIPHPGVGGVFDRPFARHWAGGEGVWAILGASRFSWLSWTHFPGVSGHSGGVTGRVWAPGLASPAPAD